MDIIHAMVANPMLVVAMLIMLVLFAFFMVAFLFPLIDTVRGLIENGDASRYLKRTPLGEREAECVYGIRNYVRDFTSRVSGIQAGAVYSFCSYNNVERGCHVSFRARGNPVGRRGQG